MSLVDIEGVGKVELDGDVPDATTLKVIQKYKDLQNIKGTVSGIGDDKSLPRNSFGQIVAPEIPYMERFSVAAAPNLESKVATLKKIYSDVKQDPLNSDNFIVTDSKGKKFQVNDISKTNFGDVIDLARPIAQIAGSSIGAIAGAPTGAGAVATAGAGMAAGSELVERLGQLAGTEIHRTPSEYLKDRALDIAIGAGAEAAGPLVLKGLQRVIRGPLTMVKGATDAEGNAIKISEMAQRIEQFTTAGVNPTLTQATEGQVANNIGGILSKFPVAAQILKDRAIKQQNDLGQKVVDIASKLIGKEAPATGFEAGQALKRGIGVADPETGLYGADSFISKFRGQNAVNYAKVNELIPEKTLMGVDNTLNYFKQKVGQTNSLDALKPFIADNKIEGMLGAMLTNIKNIKKLNPTAEGTILPYTQLNQLRMAIGEKIANYSINEPLSRGFYKGLYGSLSKDIEAGAKAVGDDAFAAMKAANLYYKTNTQALDDFLNPILEKVNIDNITNSILKNAENGPTQIRALKKALNDKEFHVVVSNIIDNLGKKTTTDLLNKEGDLIQNSLRTNYFNTNAFLKNWNKLDGAGKESIDILFNSTPVLKGVQKDITNIARVSNEIEKANPFGSALAGETSRITGYNMLLGSAVGAATGAIGVSAGFLPALATLLTVPAIGLGGAVAAKAFSNPAFLKWLSKGVDIAGNKGVNGAIEHLGKIPIIMAQSDPESRVFSNKMYSLTEKTADNFLKQPQQPKQTQSQVTMPTPSTPIAQGPTTPNVNMFAGNTQQAQGQGQQQNQGFTNIPQEQLNKYNTLFGKVV